jgi:hypothetical protein
LAQGPNPRFVVTSLAADAIAARTLYEDVYCARRPRHGDPLKPPVSLPGLRNPG